MELYNLCEFLWDLDWVILVLLANEMETER
jgi:hypothetical protein